VAGFEVIGDTEKTDGNCLEINNLQTMPLFKARFWPKNRAVLQKYGGPTEII
jgi:hypothetical protein